MIKSFISLEEPIESERLFGNKQVLAVIKVLLIFLFSYVSCGVGTFCMSFNDNNEVF